MSIEDFIKQNNCDSYKFACSWNNTEVYLIWNKEDEGAIVGLPIFAIKEGETFRIPFKDSEIFSIMDSMPD